VAYLHAIVEGAVRVDLDGTASGNVTAKEATHAAGQMKRQRKVRRPALFDSPGDRGGLLSINRNPA
jgi:sRNA-binding protein